MDDDGNNENVEFQNLTAFNETSQQKGKQVIFLIQVRVEVQIQKSDGIYNPKMKEEHSK